MASLLRAPGQPTQVSDVADPWRNRGARRLVVLANLALTVAFWGATPLLADECVDGDGDHFVVCDACDAGLGDSCGDCNDADEDINLDATELCDFVDNDCDGLKDEDFVVGRESSASVGYDCKDGLDNDGDGGIDYADAECLAALCSIGDPAGCSDGAEGGCCLTSGFFQCTPDETGTICDLNGPQRFQDTEGPAGSPICFDTIDNDCDHLTDHQQLSCQTDELCNGFDDDGDGSVDDGFGLGTACTAGTGFCERDGVVICDPDDSTQAKCGAVPGAPAAENTPGIGKCVDVDMVDDDCDGLANLADPSCQTDELCDSLDNDGDEDIDEDFADLGEACSKGQGTCFAEGVKVCSADGSVTLCAAVSAVATVEGPIGPTCSDGIDNDCDGFEDMGDSSCDAAALSISCALPFVVGTPGSDCGGKHIIVVETSGASDSAVVTTELLGLDPQGTVLATLPAAAGDEVHMLSRQTLHARTMTNSQGVRHQLFAPVPMLRVTVDDGGVIAQAYCTNIPYLDVVAPSGEVVSADEGDVTLVRTAIPFVAPSTLDLRVDGVDILDALGIDPATAFAGPGEFGPFGGTVDIGGKMVEVEDLFVRTALSFDEPSANSLTMTLRNLGGGGHIVFVDGEPEYTNPPVPPPTAFFCHHDDVMDTGTVAVFGIEITSPTAGEVTNTVPTPVIGEVRHGRQIVAVEVNGLDVDTSAQVCTTGDGTSSADECVVPISVALGQTNLTTGSAGGTFDRGQNDVLARAKDDDGNLAHAAQRFTVGDTIAPGVSAAAQQFLQAKLHSAAATALRDELVGPLSNGFTLQNAIVLGVSAEGINTFFASTCKAASLPVKEALRKAMIEVDLPSLEVDAPFPACNPTAHFEIADDRGDLATLDDDPPENQRSVRFTGDVECTAVAQEGQVHITVGLPTATAIVHVTGGCHTSFLGICVSEVILNTFVSGTLSGFQLTFDVTEDFALAGGDVPSEFITDTATVAGAVLDNPPPANEVNCIGVIAAVVGFFTFGIGGLIAGLIFEFSASGLINAAVLAVAFEGINVKQALRTFETDPMKVQEFKLDEINAELQSRLGFVHQIVDVQITEGGLVGSLQALWEVQTPDPEWEGGASSTNTIAPPPVFPIPGSKDAFFAMSDDLFSMLYSGLTLQGAFRAECVASGLTVLDLLPADCDALGTAAERGRCKGARMEVVCDDQPLLERGPCNRTRNRLQDKNIFASTDLLFCARRGITPRLLIEDEASEGVVETRKHFNDMKVTIVLDRQVDGVIGQSLIITPNCFNLLAGSVNDCKWADACFDVDVNNNFTLSTSADGDPQILPTVGGVQDNPPGMQCGGALDPGNDEDLLTNAGASDPINIIANNFDALTPLFETEGFTFGDFVLFDQEALFSIETQVDSDCPSCAEYFGFTAELTEQDP